jgi:hypothetical protein
MLKDKVAVLPWRKDRVWLDADRVYLESMRSKGAT